MRYTREMKKGFTPLEITYLSKDNGNAYIRMVEKKRFLSLTGFTLVELMLVVIIIGILVGMVVPRLTGRSEQARIAAAKADIQANLGLALDLYELDNGRYPEKLEYLWTQPSPDEAPNWHGSYLKKYPPLDPWGNEYKYICENGKDYTLRSLGPDGVESEDDITSE